ncbi:unnamed protein product [Symbiodinium pilosum]|uniref:C3H1-type domain-containing protein n=1 Tax=Symbiodinium pilosum TaxID=2952 RepID=A0A812WBU9_SYMPI|nr:unnamed protein product [Symbiodinium pilosum]
MYYDFPSPEREDQPGGRDAPQPAESHTRDDEAGRLAMEPTGAEILGGADADCLPQLVDPRDVLDGGDAAGSAADMGSTGIGQAAEGLVVSTQMPDLPPGFHGDVPPGPLESKVAAAVGEASGTSYIAKSLDAMGTVLSSLLGRMASLEQQRSSNRSSTPTSDGIEGQLHQLSLNAESTFREGRPFLVERPLASAERIMAGTFSSDDSETARRRAEEARRVIPGGLMGPQGNLEQTGVGERWTSGTQTGLPQTSSAMDFEYERMNGEIPPPPPSTLGYFWPPERQTHAGAAGSAGRGGEGVDTALGSTTGALLTGRSDVGNTDRIAADFFEWGRDASHDRPRPPPGPPPPSPPMTPKSMPRAIPYGLSTTASRTPGGTPVPASPPDNIEEPSKLVNKLPCLPSVKGTTGGDAAVMAGDWLAQLAPSMATLSPGAATWWRELLQSVMTAYAAWLESSPIVRLNLRQKVLADVPPLDRFQRVEQRAAMLLLECLPEDLKAEAISTRATSVKGMLFLTLCCYQPGGAGEKHHLQQFLTTPEVATNLDSGVTLARKWIRLFRRGKELQVILPDPQLLVRGLDRLISKVLAEGKTQSSSTFRIASFKLERQLDYKPTESGVLDFAQMILGELEAAVLALAPAPVPKVAAFQEAQDVDGNVKGKGKSKSKSKAGAKPCWKWTDGSGCRFGLACSFAHDPLGPGRCWVCGSSEHMKPQCPYGQTTTAGAEGHQGGDQPSGGGGGHEEPKPKKQPKRKPKKEAVRKAEEEKPEGPKPAGEPLSSSYQGTVVPSGNASASASSQQEFLQEATKVLKSMRLAKLTGDGEGKCLVDGGATTSMRRASSEDEVRGLPCRTVKLAVGETYFYVNEAPDVGERCSYLGDGRFDGDWVSGHLDIQ